MAGVPPHHRHRPPWSSLRSSRASFGHARPSLGAGRRVDHVGVDTTAGELAVGEKPSAKPLPYLCLSDVWGPTDSRFQLSVGVGLRPSSFISNLDAIFEKS